MLKNKIKNFNNKFLIKNISDLYSWVKVDNLFIFLEMKIQILRCYCLIMDMNHI